MPLDFISAPTEIRRQLKRLIAGAEEIEWFLGAFDDEDLAAQLIRARHRGVDVHVTIELDERTPADLLDRLIDAGVVVNTYQPREYKRRTFAAFGANVWLFDSTTDWRTGAIVGSFDATVADLKDRLVAATLLESDDFTARSEVGTCLVKLLQWVDALNVEPLTDRQRAKHREDCEARARLQRAAARQGILPSGNGGAAYTVEVKFISPLSWQELRDCAWEDYFQGLLDAERQRPDAAPTRALGPQGWLCGIDEAQVAFREGPDRWIDPRVRDELVGAHAPSDCLGRLDDEHVIALFEHDEAFRTALHQAIERCVADPQPGTLRHALAPLLQYERVTVAILSRFLAAAAPDRFVSMLNENVCLRLSDIVGFDVRGEGLGDEAKLDRYVDAMEQLQGFPWASALSAERSTDHPDEADAWSKRAALLGCLVC